ncbi:MAG TPA: polysaccharide deacetylase family protein [Vicinamibacterales bacterium]|nr:polysaccharide deacetylase family protein [Vicinamibacterales bacterium]
MTPSSIKQSLKRQLSSDAVWPTVTRLFSPAALVLAYHRVGPADAPFRKVTVEHFRGQMAWLRRHCTVLRPTELRAAVEHPPARLPVLVTFDDGYRDYFEHAVPILREFDIHAVNFVATQFVDDGAVFWWDLIDLACRRTQRTSVSLPWQTAPLPIRDADDRMRVYRECQQHLKTVVEADKQRLLPRVLAALDVEPSTLAIPRQVMTWDEMRATRDVTTYGGHLHSHPLVSRIDGAQLDAELRLSHQRMQAELGVRPSLFAYPDGDITDAAKTIVQSHGYDIAFGVLEGLVTRHSDWMAIDRLTGPATVADLAWRIARLHRRHPAHSRRPLPL